MNPKLLLLRQRIEHEDNLINRGLSAMVGSQAFLVSGFAISLNAPKEFFFSTYAPAHLLLTQLLPGTVSALNGLHTFATQCTTPEEMPIHSSTFARWLGLSAVFGVPLIFLTLWSALLLSLHSTHL
jgi:hypothetical protein